MIGPKFIGLTGIAALAAGCSGSGSGSCFAGDESAQPELTIVHRTVDGTLASTEANGTVPMVIAPQGGMFLFVGVRARNLDGCPVEITSSLRDEMNNSIVSREKRHIELKVASDGWLEPVAAAQIGSFSNLAACPLPNAERNINDETYLLEVEIEDDHGRTASSSVHIVPTCAIEEQRAACECQCHAAGPGQCLGG